MERCLLVILALASWFASSQGRSLADIRPVDLIRRLATSSHVSSECVDELKQYLNQFLGPRSILTLLQFTGKGLNELGDYRGCKTNHGRYMLLSVEFPLPMMNFGLCLPSRCRPADLQPLRELLVSAINGQGGLQGKNLTLDEVFVRDIDQINRDIVDRTSSRAGLIIITVLVAAVIAACVVSTAVDALYPIPAAEKGRGRTMLSAFNIITNARTVLYEENRLDKNLDVFNGLRVASMFWIMLGHGFSQLILMTPLYNLQDFISDINTKRSIVLFTAAIYAVDMFFTISGFFAAVSCSALMKSPKARGFMGFFSIMVQRYIRLTPIYLVIFLIYMNIVPLLYDGPLYYRIMYWQMGCEDYSYANFIYGNNFVDSAHCCMPWTWYISCEFQMFIIMPPLTTLYLYKRSWGLSALASLAVGTTAVQIFISYHYSLGLRMLDMGYVNYIQKFYNLPYCRCGPYLLGILLGWMYLSHKNEALRVGAFERVNGLITNSSAVRYVIYLVGIVLAAAIVYFYPKFYMEEYVPVPQKETTAYMVSSHTLFPLGIMCMVYAACLGKARVVSAVSSFTWFAPLARITYSAYMLHLMLYYVYMNTMEEGMYFSIGKAVMCCMEVFAISYAASFVMTLMFESPIIRLSKYFLRGSGRPKAIDASTANPKEGCTNDSVVTAPR